MWATHIEFRYTDRKSRSTRRSIYIYTHVKIDVQINANDSFKCVKMNFVAESTYLLIWNFCVQVRNWHFI